ncbi:MAG: FtsW/RodA/SpoVE family cell cycle protein [Candidatus Merdivicinus sp.]|jgi:rod shape determining protein RodA
MKEIWLAVKRYFRRLDKVLLLLCAGAVGFSLTILYSELHAGFITSKQLKMQLLAGSLGLIAMIVMTLINYRFLAKLWFLHLPVTLGLVLATFVLPEPFVFKPDNSDDVAWLRFGSLSLQPSELLKISFILTFALHLSKVREEMHKPLQVVLLCIHGAVPCLLIFKQGDMGSALIFFFIFLCMIFTAGLQWRYVLGGVAAIGAAIPIIWFSDSFHDYLQRRILVLADIENSTLAEAYQQQVGQKILGSGQVFGKGLFSDDLNYVFAIHNDFILAHIGQTLGFAGCTFVVMLLVFICIKVLLVARMSTDPLGCYICVGVFAMFFFQFLINVGMVLCLVPVIGITMPFISYGGTSLLASFCAMGLVMSVYSFNRKRIS